MPVLSAERAGRASMAMRNDRLRTLRPGTGRRASGGVRPASNFHILPQERLGERSDVVDATAFHDDRVLDLAPSYGALVVDRGERADQGVLHDRALPDDGRAPDDRPRDLGPGLDRHPPDHAGLTVDLPLDPRLHVRE